MAVTWVMDGCCTDAYCIVYTRVSPTSSNSSIIKVERRVANISFGTEFARESTSLWCNIATVWCIPVLVPIFFSLLLNNIVSNTVVARRAMILLLLILLLLFPVIVLVSIRYSIIIVIIIAIIILLLLLLLMLLSLLLSLLLLLLLLLLLFYTMILITISPAYFPSLLFCYFL